MNIKNITPTRLMLPEGSEFNYLDTNERLYLNESQKEAILKISELGEILLIKDRCYSLITDAKNSWFLMPLEPCCNQMFRNQYLISAVNTHFFNVTIH